MQGASLRETKLDVVALRMTKGWDDVTQPETGCLGSPSKRQTADYQTDCHNGDILKGLDGNWVDSSDPGERGGTESGE